MAATTMIPASINQFIDKSRSTAAGSGVDFWVWAFWFMAWFWLAGGVGGVVGLAVGAGVVVADGSEVGFGVGEAVAVAMGCGVEVGNGIAAFGFPIA